MTGRGSSRRSRRSRRAARSERSAPPWGCRRARSSASPAARSAGPASYQVGSDIDVALGEGRRTGRWQWLAELAAEAYGLPRHLSQHSGGMVISTRPLIDCCPVVPAAMEGRQMVMWDKDSCSDAGFLKIDLLGLGMLSSVERCVELIHQRRPGEEPVDLSRIPFDDAATYASIQRAETTGVFQIESRAQMGSLRRTRPRNLAELAIQVAIVRPGPIVGGAVNPYIERLQRLREDPDYVVPYEHPSLEPALRETLGTIIFQDQVIEVAQAFAGFTPARRRDCAGRCRASAPRRRWPPSTSASSPVRRASIPRSTRRWRSASGRWSPGSPASAFRKRTVRRSACSPTSQRGCASIIRPEFLCSLLDEQPMGFYPPDALVHEAQRRGIAVLVPDVNASSAELHGRRGPRRGSAAAPSGSGSATSSVCAPTTSPRSSPRARRTGRSRRSTSSLPAPPPGGRRSSSSRGRAPAMRSSSPKRRAPATSLRRSPPAGSRSGGSAQLHLRAVSARRGDAGKPARAAAELPAPPRAPGPGSRRRRVAGRCGRSIAGRR